MNKNISIDKNDLVKELSKKESHLRLELLEELRTAESEHFNYWMHWRHGGETFDVNVFNDDLDIVFQAYFTKFDGQSLNTNARKVVAETRLNLQAWKTMAAAMVLPTHNVELTITLSIDIAIQSLSSSTAIEKAITQFNDGNLDLVHALEHCECRAIITDDIPPIGDNCFAFNVFESLSKDVEIYAQDSAEAEDHLRNYIATHVRMDADDSIGIDILGE